ncbi:unnamed protein product [Lactuca virosa]|uniref:Uncharacterized protein n=1 Tax=Lactuca virosa TaxID=75947 RepID=A0AAU9P374_9ASTR|nr:unnamed protein product [Lactuca virosa]
MLELSLIVILVDLEVLVFHDSLFLFERKVFQKRCDITAGRKVGSKVIFAVGVTKKNGNHPYATATPVEETQKKQPTNS